MARTMGSTAEPCTGRRVDCGRGREGQARTGEGRQVGLANKAELHIDRDEQKDTAAFKSAAEDWAGTLFTYRWAVMHGRQQRSKQTGLPVAHHLDMCHLDMCPLNPASPCLEKQTMTLTLTLAHPGVVCLPESPAGL